MRASLCFKVTLGIGVLLLSTLSTAQSEPASRIKRIDGVSVSSLLLRVLSHGHELGQGTGFVVQKGSNYFLVTNWHVVTFRRPDSGASLDPEGRMPDQIQILHNTKGKLGDWHWVTEDLLDPATGKGRWSEHPILKSKVDVVVFPLAKISDCDLYPVDLELRNTPILLTPAAQISIVGFPFGRGSYKGLPVWKSGAIASDPDLDYDDTPQFLVDASGKPGMSGSPVWARREGGFIDESGGTNLGTGIFERFLGVYAGEIDGVSQIGRVWKASALMEIYNLLK